ncbi:MAG: signal peptidase I [Patescibacteria group bacterium]
MSAEIDEIPEESEQGLVGKIASFFLELIKIALLAGLTIGLVRYFLFKPFYVKGQSMEPNFFEHDYLIIDEISYRFRVPQRGEVIVFRSPVNEDYYLKRVVGLPGERVKVEENKIVIFNAENPQGLVVNEPYLEEITTGSINLTLSDDQFFVLGDNRDSSYDSRRFGPIEKEAIVGRVWLRGWPFNRLGTFSSNPSYYIN